MAVTRRGLIVGGVAGLAALSGAGLQDSRIRAHLGDLFGAGNGPSAPTGHGPLVSGRFTSAASGGPVGWAIAYPPGYPVGARLPVSLVLHGRGSDHANAFGDHQLHRFLAEVVAAGTAPFALAAVDGGNHSYWHRRANGTDSQQMLTGEFLPLLTDRGLETTRIGLAGWSMGGCGALLLAERLGAHKVAAVAVDSPALWRHASETAAGAFDDAADYQRNDVFAATGGLRGIPLRVTCGTADPFNAAVHAFVASLPGPVEAAYPRGGHTLRVWRSVAAAQLAFLGTQLGVRAG